MRGADAAAAAGRHVAPRALARKVAAGRREFGRDLRPVALQFLGHELGEAGFGALAHFGAGDTNHDGVIRADDHPGIDFRRPVLGAHDGGAERNLEADGKPATGSSGTDDKGAAIHFWHSVHEWLPAQALAAAWIAARTC